MIPLHVLTGFLGAGKTTVLARLLREPAAAGTFVLVNEAADLPLDHHLLERLDDDVLALPSGCACCAVRDELVATVGRVLAHRPARLVVETSGLSDPAPILHALASDPRLARRLRLAGVVAVADAAQIEELLATQPEARAQLEHCDRVVLTKTDLAPDGGAAARALVASAAPGREVRSAVEGAVDAGWLLADAPLGRLRDVAAARAWLHHAPGGGGRARTHAIERLEPARVELLQLWLSLAAQLDGPRLLRVKALVECAETGGVFALQSAGRSVSPPRRLATPPAGVRGVRLVAIERGLPERALRRLLDAFEGALAATPARGS